MCKIDNEEVQVLLPERQALVSVVNRNKNIHGPLIPQTLTEFSPPFDWTLQCDQFLKYDSDVGDDN